MKTTDFEKLDLFQFTNKKEQEGKIFRVHSVSNDWMQCRQPKPVGHEYEGEARFSFSNDYLKNAEVKMLGKGMEPDKPKVYTKPRVKLMAGQVKARRKKK